MYNDKIKLDFLTWIRNNEGVLKEQFYRYLFKLSETHETVVNKDLFLFSREEINEVLTTSNTNNIFDITGLVNCILEYKNYAIITSIIPKDIDIDNKLYSDLIKNSDIDKYYISIHEYRKILDRLENAQDQALLVLIWNNIYGTCLEEVSNIKTKDFNYEKRWLTYTTSLGVRRKVIFTSEEADILKRAILQTTYKTLVSGLELTLGESPFLIRPLEISKNEICNAIPYKQIVDRLDKLCIGSDNISLNHSILYYGGLAYLTINRNLNIMSASRLNTYFQTNGLVVDIPKLRKTLMLNMQR